MAALFKREGSPYWYGKFQHGGKRHVFSTKEKRKVDAARVLERKVAVAKGSGHVLDLLGDLRRQLDGLRPSEQAERWLDFVMRGNEQVSEKLTKEADANYRERFACRLLDQALAALDTLPPDAKERIGTKYSRLALAPEATLPLSECWPRFLKLPRRRMLSENTAGTYRGLWRRFHAWAEKQGLEHLHDVTPRIAEEYALDLQESGIAPRTFNSHVVFLGTICNGLALQAGLTSNPFSRIVRKDKSPEGWRNLTTEEIANVLRNAEGETRVMVVLGLYTGMRLGDVCRLSWSQVHLEIPNPLIRFTPNKTKYMGKEIEVPIHSNLLSVLTDWRDASSDDSDTVVPIAAALYSHSPSSVSRKLQIFFRSCGIETNRERKRGKRRVTEVGFHSLRHSFVSLCAKNKVPRSIVMELVGHSSPSVTRIYTHYDGETLNNAIRVLPSLDGEEQAS